MEAAEIEAWLERVAETYNVLPMDRRTFREWARLMHRRPNDLIEDAMIAVAAVVYSLTVVTRKVRGADRARRQDAQFHAHGSGLMFCRMPLNA